MKKLFVIFVAVLLLFCSCSDLDAIEISGDASKSTLSRTEGNTLYVANISSKTYHLPSCYIVKNMKAENRYETKDVDFLLEREFKPCKKCIKAD